MGIKSDHLLLHSNHHTVVPAAPAVDESGSSSQPPHSIRFPPTDDLFILCGPASF